MTTIYLIRHAEAEGNRYRRAHGWYNSTITDRGYHQIAALAKRFADTKFDAVYSSDRFRTMITALAIYKTHGLPLRTVRALREIDVGYWEDTPWAELERIDPEQLAYFSNDSQKWHVDGCESFAEVRDRMRKVLTDIAKAHPNETVAVFSHGMAMRIIVGTLQGMTLHEIDKTGHAENTAVAKLEYENGTFNVIFRDDASHLGDNIATVRKQPWVNDPKGFEGGIYYRSSGESGALRRDARRRCHRRGQRCLLPRRCGHDRRILARGGRAEARPRRKARRSGTLLCALARLLHSLDRPHPEEQCSRPPLRGKVGLPPRLRGCGKRHF